MSDIRITREDGEGTGRYVARLPGIAGEGEITFTRQEEGIISADHTGVPDTMEGQGVAKALLEFMLDDARESGFRIVPICPFIRGQYEKHPEWADLFTTRPGEKPKLRAKG
ncbi:hypothetical protein SAMN05421538_102409 [Paracoccus isoporae]|uniref:N-acetyltransferase domain-containing protein n=1 Tax=Paracoccus isoporae TaxID=591205 RepID=A0A1G6XHT9_9RHOB|nr:GNAT family N-acetyltransferase [Paracoccus isoporae]SDD77768.1 hypothetical protein SAMN05421538_102409 [Paracoccus isoporae]